MHLPSLSPSAQGPGVAASPWAARPSAPTASPHGLGEAPRLFLTMFTPAHAVYDSDGTIQIFRKCIIYTRGRGELFPLNEVDYLKNR